MQEILRVWKEEITINNILIEEEKLKELEKPECYKCRFYTWYTGEQDCMGLPIIGTKPRCSLQTRSTLHVMLERALTGLSIVTVFKNARECDHFENVYVPEIEALEEKIKEMKQYNENTHVKSEQVKNEKIIFEKEEGEKRNASE